MEDQNPEVIRESANQAEDDLENAEEHTSAQQDSDRSDDDEEAGGQEVLPETDLA
ncbi:hypothetical protein [Leucobacter sp. NPDC077196]|uniref:hypothetical protein n=1 Tax=Leucobacter sp. NPDC077196 TaxID=3154959 RepID=UPI00342610FD